jgi:hypothetical protein
MGCWGENFDGSDEMIGGWRELENMEIRILDISKNTSTNKMANSKGIGVRGSAVVKVLCYKTGGRGFDTQWGDFFKFKFT